MACSSNDVWIESPLSNTGSNTINNGEQIIFGRSFDSAESGNPYFEFNQKISHVLDIHDFPERNAWYKLDGCGDVEDIVKIIKFDGLHGNETGIVVCMKIEVMGKYATVNNLELLCMYDFTRCRLDSFSSWGYCNGDKGFGDSNSIFGRLVVVPTVGSYSTGFQLINIQVPEERIIDDIWGTSKNDKKQYCSYISHDWKNKKITEFLCNPSCLANYFTESTLPFEITPAFFKPEVLTKYKSDRTKYRLRSGSVSCRGAWHLEKFDINSAGQVHTYLIYLSRLPYEEQLHWKQFNEYPKAPIF